ncbi:MAG: TonB-dependent receptor [Pseudomonadota bacterium]
MPPRLHNSIRHALLAAAVASLLPASATPAAEAPDAIPVLEEIVVTAQRRVENLQDVPVSVSVVDAGALRAVGARDLSVVASVAPRVAGETVVTQSGASASSIYIRGIGQSDLLQTTDPGVGLFVDGVYVARAVGSLLDVADVERVEILRGPQGTLFGRNTIGGAINVTTRDPGTEFGGAARVTVGSDDRLEAFARLDAPLSPTLRSKLTVASFDQDGYVERPNVGDALGNRNSRAARARLLWSPAESLRVSFTADLTRTDEKGVPATLARVVLACPAGVTNAIGGCDRNTAPGSAPGQALLFNNVPPVNRAAGGAGVGVSRYDSRWVSGDPYVNLGTGPEVSRLDLWGASLTVDWKPGSFAVRSISAWRTFDAFFVRDTDSSPFAIVTPNSTVDQRQLSQEVHVYGTTADSRLDWLAGLYWLDERADDDSDFVTASFDVQSGGRDIDARSAAVFGQATWRLAPTFALTGGARYTDEHKTYTPTQFFRSSVTGQPPAGLVIVPSRQNAADFAQATWRAAAEFTPRDEVLLYAAWSTGFKSGGFVQRNQVPRQWLATFGPETVEMLEVGLKTTLAEGRVRLAGAAFAGDYEDLHIRIVEPVSFSPVTANAGDARIRGGELEVEALLHEQLRLAGGLGYLDAEYRRIAPTVPDLTLASKLVDSPAWSANVGLVGTLPLGATELSARADWVYRGETYNDAENTPQLRQPAVGRVDVSATWRCTACGDYAWSATLGVRNATDERYIVSGYALPLQGPIGATYARPREWFLTLGIEL